MVGADVAPGRFPGLEHVHADAVGEESLAGEKLPPDREPCDAAADDHHVLRHDDLPEGREDR